jgi:acetyltransferase-like isoleucine patch superfamily enzyme
VSIIGYQLRRARKAWWGEDEAVFRRLRRSGRVVYGTGSYGVPKIHTFVHDPARLIVGNYCSIGGTYLLGGQHAIKHVTTYPFRINLGLDGAGTDGNPAPRGDIVVGSDVWTGYGSWILSGVAIGDGAVVATGSVVTKDVAPYAVVGGIPARVIRYRHSEEQREALLDIRWWDWPERAVHAAIPLLAAENIDAFIAYARSGQGAQTSISGES